MDYSASILPTSSSVFHSVRQTTSWELRLRPFRGGICLRRAQRLATDTQPEQRRKSGTHPTTAINHLPENRVYRYNFFYDNCATRPRDKIEESIDGKVIYPAEPQDGSLSFRDIVHQYCKGHPWARFGIDLCIGSEADRPITQRQMMFAPFYLMDAFAGAQIVHDSVQRPLVSGKELIVDALPEEEEGGWMPTRSNVPSCFLYLPQLLLSTASAKGQDSGVSTLFYSVPQASWAVCWPSSPYSPNIRLSAPISYCWYSIRDSFCSFHTSFIVSEKERNAGI